ncbi:DUF4012 domain-containing protein [Microbacterium sp. P05]|uniref:DUF4012 domain-containing protein n=1 Tax=Microbacterium sp. P05 TaxID=3366948 RepID=UPI003746F1CF
MVAWTLAAILLLTVLAAAWIGVRGFLAYGHLTAAQDAAAEVTESLDDPAAAATAIDRISADTAAARALTSDPIWQGAESVPWIGPQLSAVATVTAAVDDVAGSALRPLADVASSFSLDALRPQDGAIDVSLFRTLAPAARTGADGIAAAAASVDSIDTTALLAPLRTPIEDTGALLHSATDGADALARASELLPTMLGADGPRTYLVVFQNNAEWRSLGGIVGAMAVISTDGGRMSLVDQGSSSDFRRFTESVLPLPEEVAQVYGQRPGLFIQNVTQVPEFPLAAQLSQEMWARETGTRVDGVISLDPVALSYLLAATGPVTLPTGDVLTSDNAVEVLLSGVYQRYERPADQDLFFEVAAASVFQALSSGQADPTVMLEALAQAGDERRLLLWNSDPAAQAVLDGTTLQGGLPVTDADQTSFGVYLNDGTGSKMDYYLAAGTATAWCTDTEGGADAALTVTLRNDAPADAASLPPYITGGGSYGVPVGVARTLAYIYLPAGAELVAAKAAGASVVDGFGGGTDQGRQILTWPTDLAPGETATLTIRVSTPQTATLQAALTPSVNALETSKLASACEIPQ